MSVTDPQPGQQSPWLGGGAALAQLGIVVPDLPAALNTYTAIFGIGPWQVFQVLGMFPTHFEASFRALLDRGFECTQQSEGYGQTRDGRYAYFDTGSVLHGLAFEIIQVPIHRWDPIEIWPVDGPPVITEEAHRPWPR